MNERRYHQLDPQRLAQHERLIWTDMVVYACNSSTLKVEVREIQVGGRAGSVIRPCLKKRATGQWSTLYQQWQHWVKQTKWSFSAAGRWTAEGKVHHRGAPRHRAMLG